ncbi:hypothetical protein F5X99DRAFT_404800 [Biscogniauxia marginata]|nr:hypothetical protein F5X99DRAFT_404800 [Biscogniauxia marginata]
MADQNIQAQWSLDPNWVFSISQEKNVLPTPSPVKINFFDGEIGFPENDCAVQLGRSQAGLRFLGLAAALISTTGTLRSATTLSVMLEATSSNRIHLPTAENLLKLVSSLEDRCRFVNFSDLVHSYELKIHRGNPDPRSFPNDGICAPSEDVIRTLMDLFRELQTIDPSLWYKIIVKTDICGPWVAAFAHWCLGISPSISWENGRLLINVLHISYVDVIVSDSPRLEIIKKDLEGHYELVHTGQDRMWHSSMVGFDCLRDRILHSLGPFDRVKRAVIEQLPLAVHVVWSDWIFPSDPDGEMPSTKPFPEAHVVLKTLSEFLGVDFGTYFPKFASENKFADDRYELYCGPYVDSLLQWIKEPNNPSRGLWPRFVDDDYGSGGWFTEGSIPLGVRLNEVQLNFLKEFYELLSRLSVIILLLSLYEDRRNVRFSSKLRPYQILHARAMDFLSHNACRTSRSERKTTPANVLSVLHSALTMVGRDDSANFESWVMEYIKGQVFWPSIYDNLGFRRHGFLSLASARGSLTYQGAIHTRVESDMPLYLGKNLRVEPFECLHIILPRNLSPGLRVVWDTTRRGNFLFVKISLYDHGGPINFSLNPNALLFGLAEVILVDCLHDQRRPYDPDPMAHHAWYSRDQRLDFTPRELYPCFELHKLKDTLLTLDQSIIDLYVQERRRRIFIPVDNEDEQLQLFCTGFHIRAVVRRDACCECSANEGAENMLVIL